MSHSPQCSISVVALGPSDFDFDGLAFQDSQVWRSSDRRMSGAFPGRGPGGEHLRWVSEAAVHCIVDEIVFLLRPVFAAMQKMHRLYVWTIGVILVSNRR